MDKNILQSYKDFAKKSRIFFKQTYKSLGTRSMMSDNQLQKDLAVYFNKLLENQERWRVVNNITQQINSTMNLTSLYKIVIEQLLTILDINYCEICIYNELKNEFNLHYNKNNAFKDCHKYLKNIIGNCNKIIKNKNFNSDETIHLFSSSLNQNYSSVPLINKNKFLGSIFVYNSEHPIDRENKEILTLVADNIAFAVTNANLYSILEKKDKDKLEFIASMSHEFKNPLNTIIGFINLLKEGAIHDSEKAIKYLNNINISSIHMSNLITDILDMTRAETGNIELHYDEFSPRMLILETLATQESLLKNKSILLRTNLNDFPIFADSKRFRQVIYNLVSNAAKYTHNGGFIEITTHCENEYFYFEIKDNGEGISKENQNKLFKFFSQVNDNQDKRREGHGIGLAVCKKIIDLHKGEINFKSKKNAGTTFWFKLPVKNTSCLESTII